MTNRELLRAPPHTLSPLDRQRRQVLAAESAPVPCAACTTPVGGVAAAGLDVDAYPTGAVVPPYRCPHCRAVLARVTPPAGVGPGWCWELDRAWLADRLKRADRYDAEHSGG